MYFSVRQIRHPLGKVFSCNIHKTQVFTESATSPAQPSTTAGGNDQVIIFLLSAADKFDCYSNRPMNTMIGYMVHYRANMLNTSQIKPHFVKQKFSTSLFMFTMIFTYVPGNDVYFSLVAGFCGLSRCPQELYCSCICWSSVWIRIMSTPNPSLWRWNISQSCRFQLSQSATKTCSGGSISILRP